MRVTKLCTGSPSLFAVIAVSIVIAASVLLTGTRSARADTRVALAPLDTLGSRSKSARKVQARVAQALASVPDIAIVPGRTVRTVMKRTPALRACEGSTSCLVQLGQKAGATHIVYGELGGLGDVEIVYLTLVDVAAGRSVRSTTIELGGADETAAARSAAFRLLAPRRYVGTLALSVDAAKASIYIDGTRAAEAPTKPLTLSVGTHALRITHPEFRDYVRFIDIEFDQTTTIEVNLQQYAVVSSDMARDPKTGEPLPGGVIYRGVEPTPWYRKWYTLAGVSGVLLVGSAVVVGILASGIDRNSEEVVRDPPQR